MINHESLTLAKDFASQSDLRPKVGRGFWRIDDHGNFIKQKGYTVKHLGMFKTDSGWKLTHLKSGLSFHSTCTVMKQARQFANEVQELVDFGKDPLEVGEQVEALGGPRKLFYGLSAQIRYEHELLKMGLPLEITKEYVRHLLDLGADIRALVKWVERMGDDGIELSVKHLMDNRDDALEVVRELVYPYKWS